MKRVFIIVILAALLCPFASFAQQKVKFGHLDYGEIIKVMPGIDTVQKVVADMQADLQAKQMELLKPFQEKILEAIKEVGKEFNFTYIFDTSMLTYYEQGEDIAAKVKQKLGIK